MADKIEELTLYRIKGIEQAEIEYYKNLTQTLDRIEREIVNIADTDLPRTTDGKLIQLQSAIAIRPKIKSILDQNYLPFADQVVREGFNKQAKRIERAFKRIGNIPVEFQELTKGDLALVQNLKQQYFTQFKDVSNRFTRELSEKVYQNTLVGNTFADLEKELRQSINGIYASSDDREAQKLIDFVNDNKFKASKKDQVNKAIQTLQSKFATDRAGENMKRYAGQILNDSLRDFDATLNFNKANDAGLTYVKYYGDVIPTTREICRNMINGVYNKRESGLFTIDEVKQIWASRSWSGKKSGDPLIVRGGYNCRHQWSYVNPDWYDNKGELII
jgi:molybdopterin converting factor small subunit